MQRVSRNFKCSFRCLDNDIQCILQYSSPFRGIGPTALTRPVDHHDHGHDDDDDDDDNHDYHDDHDNHDDDDDGDNTGSNLRM